MCFMSVRYYSMHGQNGSSEKHDGFNFLFGCNCYSCYSATSLKPPQGHIFTAVCVTCEHCTRELAAQTPLHCTEMFMGIETYPQTSLTYRLLNSGWTCKFSWTFLLCNNGLSNESSANHCQLSATLSSSEAPGDICDTLFLSITKQPFLNSCINGV